MVVTVMAAGTVVDAYAASARVRCQVESNRLRVRVDGQNLPTGTYFARLRNLTTGAKAKTEPGKEQTVTAAIGDIDLDFDSTAGAADGDSFIAVGFGRVGDRVRAQVVEQATSDVEAVATTTCIAK